MRRKLNRLHTEKSSSENAILIGAEQEFRCTECEKISANFPVARALPANEKFALADVVLLPLGAFNVEITNSSFQVTAALGDKSKT